MKTVAFTSGYTNSREKQLKLIKDWCKSQNKPLTGTYPINFYDCLLNLNEGDTIVVTSLAKLSTDHETLGKILFACQKNGIGIVTLEEKYLDLSINKYTIAYRSDEKRMEEHLKFIAYKVLYQGEPAQC